MSETAASRGVNTQASGKAGHGPDDDPGARPGVHLTHRQILIIYSGLMLGMLLSALDQTIVSTALPTIAGDLGGISQISWVVTSYLLTSTVTMLLWGKLSDIYGRKVMFQAAIGIFLAASALAGVANSMMFLVVARGLQGIGAGGIMSLAFAIIGDILSPRERGKYQGFIGAVFAFSTVVGPFLGGWIVDNLHVASIPSWRWIFYINLPIGIPAIFITGIVLRLPFHRQDQRIDYTGFALQALGAAAIVLAMMWGGQPASWDGSYNLRWFTGTGDFSSVPGASAPTGLDGFLADNLVTSLLATGVLLLALFVWRQSRVEHPLLPLRLFRSPPITLANAVSFVIGAGMFGGISFLPTYLQISTGASATLSGLLLLPMMFGIILFSTVSGIVISKTGRYKMWPTVGLPLAVVGTTILSTLAPDTSTWILWSGMFLLGAGIGMTMQVMVLVVQNAVAMRDMGVGTAANNYSRQMGAVLGVGALGALFANRIGQTLKEVAPAAIQAGYDPRTLAQQLFGSPAEIHDLPPALRDPITAGVAHAVAQVFLYAVPIMALGLVLVLFLKEVPLRSTRGLGAAAMEGGEAMVPSPDAPVVPAVAAARGLPPNALARVDPRPGQSVHAAAQAPTQRPALQAVGAGANGASTNGNRPAAPAPPRLPPVRAFAARSGRAGAPLSEWQLTELHRRVDRLPDPRKRRGW